MKFNYDFIPQGSKVTKEGDYFVCKDRFTDKKWDKNQVVVLDTGNSLEPGIIDHHQPDSIFIDSCVASIVANYPEKYLGHLKQNQEVTIVTHFAPDLDALGSVYFAQKYLSGNEITPEDKVLAEYILEVDSGKLSIDPDFPISIASIWLVITNDGSNTPPFQMDNVGLIESGVSFLESVSKLLKTNNNPWDIRLLDGLVGFEKEKQDVLDDKKTYHEDLNERSNFGVVGLHNTLKGGIDKVDVILTDRPKSKLWKYWVRGDRNNSSLGEGFVFTCAFWDRRAIIAVDPNTPYHLKGLGLLIDRLEIDTLLEETSQEEIIEGALDSDGNRPGARPGFHRNDPWYDGRGFHNYTIIDAPRAGTNLTNDQITNAIFAEDCWNQYANLILFNEGFTLTDVLSLPLPTIFSVDNFRSSIDFDIQKDLFTDENLHKFELLSQKILFSPKGSFLDRKQSHDLQDEISDCLISWLDYFNDQTAGNSRSKVVNLIVKTLPAEHLLNVLQESKDLDVNSFCQIIQVAESAIKKDNLFSAVLALQDKHPKVFDPKNISQIKEVLSSNGIDSTDLINHINFLSLKNDSTNLFEELPIYGFNKLKNYIDDLLVCEAIQGDEISENVFSYTANDFDAFFGEDKIEKLENSRNLLAELKSSFFSTFFGESSELILTSRTELLELFKGNTAKIIKRYSTNQIFLLEYADLKGYIEELNIAVDSSDVKDRLTSSVFYESLVLISEFSALEYLYDRVGKFEKIQKTIENQNQEGVNPFIKDFNHLIFCMFKLISLYPNSTSIEEVEDLFSEVKELLNNLRIKAAKYDFLGTANLRESLNEFVSLVGEEISMNVSEVQEQTQHALGQYGLISRADGILSLINELPHFYRLLLNDIFYSFKRYYRERIIFFRNELGYVVDLNFIDNEEQSNEDFIAFYNKLINESIKFDWQELKDNVDNSKDAEIIKVFYDKYFNWQLLNIREDNDNLNKLNSDIRFAEGATNGSLKELVQDLPERNNIENYNSYIKELAFKWDIDDVVTHFPVYLIHNSYDFILDTYISKFDVDNVKESLTSFSTSFPWYYKWFTNKNIIQEIYLLICFLLLAVGIFDPTIYELEEETFMSPVSSFISEKIGDSAFLFIANSLQIFWGAFLSLAFTLPLLYGVYLIAKRLFIKEDKEAGNDFKFIKLVSSIEGKRSSLLYLSFILPLLLVVIQMASPDIISMINNIEGIRLISTLIIIIGLTLLSVYLSVKEKNDNRPRSWIINKTKHMFWLHLLQAILLTVFVIDLLLRFELSYEMFPTKDELIVMGISKYIEIDFGFFDFRIMPVFSILVSFLTLFFSFFIDKVIGGGDE